MKSDRPGGLIHRLRAIDPRLTVALGAAKLTGAAIRRAGRGGGTAAPGLVADRLDPALLAKIARRLPHGTIVVAGTNGKTTTSRMLADILEAAGYHVAHNRSGSNLVRGVAAAFAARASLTGDPRAEIGVIETDEAAFPEVVRLVAPRVILLNNLFRDQLDRYGEMNTIASLWRATLATLPPETTVVVNVDDPALAEITSDMTARRLSFGLAETNPRHHLAALPHAADAATCRRCGHDLVYDALYASHLGDWRCPNCGAARPPLNFRGLAIELDGVESLRMTVSVACPPPAPRNWGAGGGQLLELTVGVPGLYNAYNALAAVAVASTLGVPDATTTRALAAFRSAFGRIERVAYQGRTLVLALVKNPVGCNETLRMLTAATAGLTVPTLIAINDLAADGRDVSWLWDVDFELLADGTALLSTTGLRGADMANRLLYAGVARDRLHSLDADLAKGLDAFVASVPAGSTGYVLPTYTAMLGLRQILADRGAVAGFWEQ